MNPANLDVNLIRALHALVEERDLDRAARRARVSRAAMQSHFHRLREVFRDPILVQQGRQVIPTPCALRTASQTAEAIRLLDRFQSSKNAFAPARCDRTLRFSVSDYTMDVLLSGWTRVLRRRAPHMRLEIHPPPLGGGFDLVVSGTVDALFGAFTRCPPALQSRPLFEDDFVVVGAARNPALVELDLDTYMGASHVLVHPLGPSGTPGMVDTVLQSRGLTRDIPVHVTQFAAALAAVRNSALLTTIPRAYAVAHKHPALAMAEVPVDIPAATTTVAWHCRSQVDEALMWALDSLTPSLQGQRGERH